MLQRAGALSVALGHRPQPVNIPAEGSSAEPSPDMLPEHAAVVGSPTTTAPIMASIRRTRSNDDGMQVCTLCRRRPSVAIPLAPLPAPSLHAFQAWSSWVVCRLHVSKPGLALSNLGAHIALMQACALAWLSM